MSNRYHDVRDAHSGTCTWLDRHSSFQLWGTQPGALLWIKGKPGSGKSTLLKYALDKKTKTSAESEHLTIAFFFHGRGDELQKTPLGFYRSLLHQLLNKLPGALSELLNTFGEKLKSIGSPGQQWKWHLKELQGFLETSLPRILEVYSVTLFVDALDECGEENAVQLVHDFKIILEGLSKTKLRPIRICFSCRHYPILDSDYGHEDGLSISTEHENKEDIRNYVNEIFLKVPSNREEYIEKITCRANGIFLWAALVGRQTLSLIRKRHNHRQILKKIDEIPQDLHELYSGLFKNLQEPELTRKVIQWVYFAKRPLTTEEFQGALAIDPDGGHRSIEELKESDDFIELKNIETRITVLSCGLIEVLRLKNTVDTFGNMVNPFENTVV